MKDSVPSTTSSIRVIGRGRIRCASASLFFHDSRNGFSALLSETPDIPPIVSPDLLIVGVGLINRDFVAVTPRWGEDDKVTAETVFEQIGGPVPVALATMAKLGLSRSPVMIGIVGDDSNGRIMHEELRRMGVGTALSFAPDGVTSRSLVMIRSSDGARFVANHPGNLPSLSFTDAHLSLLQRASLVHTDGRDPETVLRAASIVRASGGKFSVDLGTMRPGNETLFPLCDFLIASRKGGAGAFPDIADDPMEQTRRFLRAGVGVAGVTLGSEGAVIGTQDEEPVLISAYPVRPVRDTCGAGDTFHGAFLWGILQGKSAIESARFAAAAVALRIQGYGHQHSLPAYQAVADFSC